MKFVDVLDKEQEFECMGCDIASHKLVPPGGYIYEDEFINVSADPAIPIPGFMVLGIKKHVKSFNDLSKEERYKICDILNLTIEKMKEINLCKEVLLINEERSIHFHVWIVPILDWMDEFDKSVKNIDRIIKHSEKIKTDKTKEEILDYANRLKEAMK